MNCGTIIILNGTSSSGKTSIVRALQDVLEEPYLEAGIDKFIWMLPKRYLDRPLWDDVLGLATEAGAVGHTLVTGMHQAIRALSLAGSNVIADHVLVEPAWVQECASLLFELPAYLVGVRCPLEMLEQREQRRKDRTWGQARAQYDLVHAHCIYDLEVDTSLSSPLECAMQIKARIENGVPPEALRRLNEASNFPKQVYIHYDKQPHAPDAFRYCPLCRAELERRETDHCLRAVCPACGYIHYRNPAPVVSLMIVSEDKVLLGRRTGEPGKGLWATVSGYIEYENDFLTTAVQEAREETGLEVKVKSILNVHSSFVSEDYHFIGIYLLAEVTGGKLAAGDDMEAVAWFPLGGPFPELAFVEDAELLERYSKIRFNGLPVCEFD